MRLIPFPRRHRALWLIAAVLGVSAWGSWLVATGRSPDYTSGYTVFPATQAAAPVSRPSSLPDVADLLATPSAAAPDPTATAAAGVSTAGRSPARPVASKSAGVAESSVPVSASANLTGMTDPLAFARAVAVMLLTYSPETDLDARAGVVMAVAALPPTGSPTELQADLTRFSPDPVLSYGGATVTFAADAVAPSPWAATRLAELRLPAGSFAIDVTGNQLLTLPGHQPVSVSVTVGITGACPPALVQCEIDRIFPRTVAQELGS